MYLFYFTVTGYYEKDFHVYSSRFGSVIKADSLDQAYIMAHAEAITILSSCSIFDIYLTDKERV